MGSVKLNVDASVDEDLGSRALGAIVRDAGGIFIAAVVSYKQHALDVPSMEALAMLLGLRLAHNLGIHDLKVASDSMEIVNSILYPAEYRASGR